jgi:hypothetical protein
MPINAEIPLQGRPLQLDNQLDNYSKMMAIKQLMLQNQTGQQGFDEQQRMRELFQRPDSVDQTTGQPTPAGLAGMYGIAPESAMKAAQLQQTGELQRAQIRGAGLTQQNQQGEIDDRTKKNLTTAHTNQTNAFVSAYDLAINKGATPEQANAAANQAWNAQLDQDKADGLMKGISPEIEQQVRQRPRDINQLRPLVTSPKDVMAANEKKIADERAMMTPLQKAQAERTRLEATGKKGSREWKENNDLIKKETAPTTMQLYAQNPLPSGTATFIADQVLHGDPSGMQGMGRNPIAQAEVKAEVARLAKERNITGGQLAAINAEYFGSKAGERTLGTRSANIEMAITEAQNVAPLALEASSAVDRTKYPDLNAIILSGQKRTGDPNVVKLGVATNSLINVYSRAIAPTGVATVSDKEHAREILSAAWSHGQYAAAVDMMMKEMEAARKSPGQVRGALRSAITGETDPSFDLNSGALVNKAPPEGGVSKKTIHWNDLK